ncbi:ABC transporter ATP-binding protein [Bifidobacterium aquikefiri]|uniref:Sugar ABC transporter ATP-binding protein n=1 Tax=Bifidobacterium aquikefiri TaxID=1653207 RepID=A0A261GAR2_9BIFI|nr:sn-glycerol-3-phosphate ABC transporter ATP-binding protein UgpC [Bifidobacterium aquikefiri]OZG68527.1 sugar ABC transporter ATP-binding protein [Bifidobacterium aquikefiri]
MAEVVFEHVTRIYPGNDKPSVDDLNLDIKDGEFLVLVGPSGCGKSTTLRMLAGLEEVNKGRILIGGKDVTTMQPKDRDIAMVFQNYALYPHMTVADNMGFALKIAGTPKNEIRQRVEKAAEILDLTEYLDRKPKALSGGQRQRVAMGRAIVREPKVFLMDEPLSNLDAKLRVQTRTQIAALQRQLGVTTLYVTHDQTEALTMGDRIAVIKLGLLQQVGRPTELYDRPANVFVAGFIGSPSMNLNIHPVVNGQAKIGDDTISLPKEAVDKLTPEDNSKIVLGFRPEDASLAGPAEPDAFSLKVANVEDLGSDGYIYGHILTDDSAAEDATMMSDQNNMTTVRVSPRELPAVGATVKIHIDPAKMHLFSTATELRLN